MAWVIPDHISPSAHVLYYVTKFDHSITVHLYVRLIGYATDESLRRRQKSGGLPCWIGDQTRTTGKGPVRLEMSSFRPATVTGRRYLKKATTRGVSFVPSPSSIATIFFSILIL
jgi:hypothetical protein